MSGKMIQPRFADNVLDRIEKRARELGYIKPSGETNLSSYVRYCVLKDLNSSVQILDGEKKEYGVE